MRPVVPSTVPYSDMRSWQRLGVKLRGQRNRRAIGMPNREARQNLLAPKRRGARDARIRPTHVNLCNRRYFKQAKGAGPGPKGAR